MWSQLVRLSKIIQPIVLQQGIRNFSILSQSTLGSGGITNFAASRFLQPVVASLNVERGMKQVGRCRRRCKDCYFIVRQERLYVMCKTHPRHKQMAMKKRVHNTWLLTDATQSTKRAW